MKKKGGGNKVKGGEGDREGGGRERYAHSECAK